MISNKEEIQRIVYIFKSKGVRHVVFSPGSRNAPFIISFNQDPYFKCITIPDERVAAFFAMGMAQQFQSPVAICCTSGSALLNYSPAIAEAFYQTIPLLVLSADRPLERIDQGAGQSIRQHNVFNNFIKKSDSLRSPHNDTEEQRYFDRTVNHLINTMLSNPIGPVHLNVHLNEPLYDTVEGTNRKISLFDAIRSYSVLDSLTYASLLSAWKQSSKKMIIVGQMMPTTRVLNDLKQIAKEDPSVIILYETISNIQIENGVSNIDKTLETLNSYSLSEKYHPEIVVTIGKAIVSKRIRKYLQNAEDLEHWQHCESYQPQDIFFKLKKLITCAQEKLTETLSIGISTKHHEFRDTWLNASELANQRGRQFLEKVDFSDLWVYNCIFKKHPDKGQIHLGNSTPIRYSQLFEKIPAVRYYSNRGVSGIDGSLSTAAGAAFTTGELVTIILGDMSFFYDSNALWNLNLTSNLRIVLINNGGGDIFNIIDGPKTTEEKNTYFVARQQINASKICKTFNIQYSSADSKSTTKRHLESFFHFDSERPKLIEINTSMSENSKILAQFFESLGQKNR